MKSKSLRSTMDGLIEAKTFVGKGGNLSLPEIPSPTLHSLQIPSTFFLLKLGTLVSISGKKIFLFDPFRWCQDLVSIHYSFHPVLTFRNSLGISDFSLDKNLTTWSHAKSQEAGCMAEMILLEITSQSINCGYVKLMHSKFQIMCPIERLKGERLKIGFLIFSQN